MVDLFEEVEGQLRTDRYRSLAIRAAPWVSGVLVIALVAALGYWGWQTYQQNQIHHASDEFNTALQMASNGDRTGAFARLNPIARSSPAAYRSLALMMQGGLKVADNRPAEAVALFDQAARIAPSPALADMASMRSIYTLMDTAPLADLERRITPLTATGRPYRLQAQEALAMARLLAGRNDAAKAAFRTIAQNLNASEQMRVRRRVSFLLFIMWLC